MLIVPEMVQKKLVFVLFGADFYLVSTFLYKKRKKTKEELVYLPIIVTFALEFSNH